jgi:outer membrane protein OmpA-like peptidoglycan-associated protein
LKGCPDKDKDGVADIDDKCPDVPGIKENKGCPEVKAEVKKVFAQALQGIQFETGKDVILKGSYPILDQVVKVMNENKEYNLEINGHTDNVGKDNLNLLLSQKRANAVKAYLVKKGIDENRMKATGYGSTMPVEDNKTAAGKAKNRRVEFKVNF